MKFDDAIIEYTSDKKDKLISSGWKNFFKEIHNDSFCAANKCSIKEKGCVNDYKGKNIVMDKSNPFSITALVDKAGYSETICVVCKNDM